MKCIVKGSGADVMKFRDRLKKELSNYPMVVTEDLPEAAAQGANFCTAVFYLNVSFLNFRIADGFYNSEVHFIWKDKEYFKRKKSSRGQFHTLVVEKTPEPVTVLYQDEELDEYEDLEHWEMRNAREL